MKPFFLLSFLAVSLISCASCNKKVSPGDNNNNPPTGSKIRIRIGNSTFTATLHNNATATELRALLPVTVEMVELNGNEKYAELSRSLTTAASNPGTIHNGDLMLYGSSTLVLFYKAFSTSYNYTKLGRIDDVTGLDTALGTGNVTVVFEAQN